MMNYTIRRVVLTTGLLCLPLTAIAEVTPDQFNLLVVASKKDGGKDFGTLVELLIAASPDDEAEIKSVAAQILPEPVVAEVVPEPVPAPPSPTAIEGTVFSDSGAKRLSQLFLPGWEKEVEINGLYTTGNTSQKSFGAGTKFERESGPHHQIITTYFDFNSSNEVTNKRRYGLAFKNDYSVSDISYVTGFASFEGDSFGAFNKRFTLNAGYGIKVFDNDDYKWNVEAGPAVLLTKPESTLDYETDILGYASSIFSWVINDRSDLSNETKVFVGNKIIVENKTDYKVQISGALSGKLSFDVLYNRDAPIDKRTTDTITRIGVLYDF